MLSWHTFFDAIYLINLDKRQDRFLHSVQQFDDYGIDFTRVKAIEDSEGARGLRDTMLLIFDEAQRRNFNNILVFEDDVQFVKEKSWIDEVMNCVVHELPENYLLCYMGGQATIPFSNYYSGHLIPVKGYFATHAVMYSKQAIKEIMARGMEYPIDNWLVSEIQGKVGHCYCVNPILASQRADYSDIGKNNIDWNPFIIPRHEQRIAELNNKLDGRR